MEIFKVLTTKQLLMLLDFKKAMLRNKTTDNPMRKQEAVETIINILKERKGSGRFN